MTFTAETRLTTSTDSTLSNYLQVPVLRKTRSYSKLETQKTFKQGASLSETLQLD